MAMRDIILENRWWKLASLAMAVSLWFYINDVTSQQPRVRQATVGREASATFPKPFPVRGLVASGDPHSYVLDPAQVEVTVFGAEDSIKRITIADILVIADLSGLPHEHEGGDMQQHSVPVIVRVAPPMHAIAEPAFVIIRQYSNLSQNPSEQ